MIYCNKCGRELPDDSLFCSKCGNKIEVDKEKTVEKSEVVIIPEVSQQIIKEEKFKKNSEVKIISVVALCIAIIGVSVFVFFNFTTPEAQAKSVVNKYLSAIKNGKSTYDYKDIDVDDYRNVLNYKYLNVELSTKENKTIEFSLSDWERFWKDLYPDQKTYSEFKKEMKMIYTNGNVLVDNNSNLKIERDEQFNVIYLLYDVEVTNGLGQKVYTKTTFKVDNSSGEYKVIYFFEN